MLVEAGPVRALGGVLLAVGDVHEVVLAQDGHRLLAVLDEPLLALAVEHVLRHLALPRAVPPADPQHESLAVFDREVQVLQLADVDVFAGCARWGARALLVVGGDASVHTIDLYSRSGDLLGGNYTEKTE